ncbi:MAG: hypothetical protein U0793_27735 [Gemmataceae bacterium]
MLLSLVSFTPAGEVEKKLAPIPGVKVTLRCALDGPLDPLDPGKHEMECVVHNGSDRPIRVPLVYMRGFKQEMSLVASAEWPLTLIGWAGAVEKKDLLLKPGEQATVFKESLNALLLLDIKEGKGTLIPGEKRYYWSWIA